MAKVRCAIYTRKSSEDGLEQEFNSLDAQREACAAYVLSQKAEGWVLLPEHYDDGGLSGGTLERPALQKLLQAVDDGLVDQIVVYKIDRLTRSLRLGHPVVQHRDQHGTVDAQHAPELRPVRKGGHGGTDPRQDRGLETKRPVDGRQCSAGI